MRACSVLFLVLQLSLSLGRAQESPPPALKPKQTSPEMLKLFNTFLGTWSVTEKIEPSETLPKGGTGRGEEVYKTGPGGVSLIEEIHLREVDRDISGLGVGWWDDKAKGFKALWCDSENPNGCILMAHLAKWEGNDFVLGDEFQRDGKRFLFKEVFSEITPTSFTQTLSQGEAGKELKTILRIHATRSHTSADSNKALFQHAVDVWAAGDMSALEQVVAPGYIGHTSTGDRNIEGLRQRIQAFHKLYDKVLFHIEDQMVDGDKVITSLTADVTMRDGGKSAKLMGINISRIADGKIVEEWNTWEPVRAAEGKNETH